MLIFKHGSTYFLNKVVLTIFINVCRMGWDSIWGTSCFYKSKTEEGKRGGKSAIWPILICRMSTTLVSTPPFSMLKSLYFNLDWEILSCINESALHNNEFIRCFHKSWIPNLRFFYTNICYDLFFNWQTETKSQ